MEWSQYLWLFLILLFFIPVLQRKLLASSRLRVIKRIEKQRNSRVITLIHRQERMSLLGIPIFRFIDINDSEAVLRAINLTSEDVPIDLIIHTPGGLALAARQIAHALLRHKAKVTVFIPHYAMSGGTLVAMAADEIVMSDNAVLGPVDPQIGEFPAASILRVIGQKDKDKIDDRTLILADVAEKAVIQLKSCVAELLRKHVDPEKTAQLADLFSRGAWTHDYPITFEEAKSLGLPVSCEMPRDIYALMELFPQPTPTRPPSVEFVPEPYRPRKQS